MNYVVYCHTNKINNKKYIGITKDKPEYRWNNGRGYKTQYFGRAIKKYGWTTFEHEILLSDLTQDEAVKSEKELIEKFNTLAPNGYNIDIGGNCGSIISERAKEKMSVKVFQYTLDGDFVAEYYSISEASRQTNVAIALISGCVNNKYQQAGSYIWVVDKNDIEESLEMYKNRRYFQNNVQAVKVFQYDLNGNFINEFSSIARAEKETGSCNISTITKDNNNKYISNGYLWLSERNDLKASIILNKIQNKETSQTKRVAKYSLSGDFIEEYYCVSEARRKNSSVNHIGDVCNGKRNQCGGFVWKWIS